MKCQKSCTGKNSERKGGPSNGKMLRTIVKKSINGWSSGTSLVAKAQVT
jgi:hypothetical protein